MSNWITIYTDGAALGNPGPGGFGVVMFYGISVWFSRQFKTTPKR